MIPKRLIYCNFGNMKLRPEIEMKCVKSWEKYFPKDEWEWYEINEKNYNVNANPYTKFAYEHKKYSAVADYARLDILNKLGGVYVDMDLLMFKPLGIDILNKKGFIGSGVSNKIIERCFNNNLVSAGIMGFEKNNPFLSECLKKYRNVKFTETNYIFDIEIFNSLLYNFENLEYKNILNIKNPFELKDLTIYPFDYFTCKCPTYSAINKKFNKTDRSYSIHLYGKSWN